MSQVKSSNRRISVNAGDVTLESTAFHDQPPRAIRELFTETIVKDSTPRAVDCGAAPVISLKVCRYGFNSVDCARRAPNGGASKLEPFAQLGLWPERCVGVSLDDRVDIDDLRANSSWILTDMSTFRSVDTR